MVVFSRAGRAKQEAGLKLPALRLCICVLLAAWIILGTNGSAIGQTSEGMLWRFFISDPAQRQEITRLGVELYHESEGGRWMDVLADQRQIDELISLGFDVEFLLTAEELKAFEPKLDPEYHTYQEMVDELGALEAVHPQIAMMESIGVSTQEERTIWAFKISDNVTQNEDEPAVMCNGAHHACEVMGLEICMRLINDLLNDYGADPDVTYWVDNTEIWFVPLVNPDGHSAVTDSISLYWRKNGRDLNGNGVLYEYECNDWHLCNTEGVDVNRNYDFNWETGGSAVPWEWDYRGEYPFSERESQAVRDLALRERFTLSVSYHSYGEYVLYPWIWWPQGSTTPDDSTITGIAREIASRICKHSEAGTYDYDRTSATTGYSDNWLYGKQGTFEFVIETVPYPIFIVPGPAIESIYACNRPGALYLLDRVRGTSITGIITDSLTGLPLHAQVKIAQLYSPDVSPRTSDPIFGRYRWLLQPGIYDLEFSKAGYSTKSYSNFMVLPGYPATLNVQLAREQVPMLSGWAVVFLSVLLVTSAAAALAVRKRKLSCFFAIGCLMLITSSSAFAAGNEMLVRVFISEPGQIHQVNRIGVKLFHVPEAGTWMDVLASEHQVDEILSRGFEVRVLLRGEELEALEPKLDPQYHTYDEMVNELNALQSAHPEIATMESVGVTTQEGRIIWAFKISDNAAQEEDEPAVMYNGAHHSCEVMGLEICMRLINDLLNDYGIDPQVTHWVDDTEIWFVPLVNPDGHSAVTDSISLYWRKNGRDLNGNGILYEYECNNSSACFTEGVDVNRNYDFNWEYGEPEPWSPVYRGQYPLSENESQAIRNLALQQKFVASISYHSYGEIVMYPWIWGSYAPDDVTLTDMASQIASRSESQTGPGTYDYFRHGAFGGLSGNCLYGNLGTFEFLIETLAGPYFIPPGSQIDTVYQALKEGALYILDRTHQTSITGIISDSLTGAPLEAQVEITQLYSPNVAPRTSDPVFGRYRWLLEAGIYDLEFSKPGYYTKSYPNRMIFAGYPAVLNVQLVPLRVPVLSYEGLLILAVLLMICAVAVLAFSRRRHPSVIDS